MTKVLEIWKDIKDYEGYYQVSNIGRVKRIAARSGTQINRILKDFDNTKGYRYTTLRKHNIPRNFYIHKLVATAFLNCPENKKAVNHINGNKADNRLENLEWCDDFENMQHASRLGLLAKGENVKLSKLKEYQVIKIRRLFSEGVSRNDLCIQFNTSKANLCRIINRELWKHI